MTTTVDTRPLYRVLADLIVARANCLKSANSEWHDKHGERLAKLCNDMLPSGSGIDCGTKLEEDACKGGARLVFSLSFHHMNDAGMYNGWTEHVATVTPSFQGIDISISGRNRNDIKDYLAETLHYCLTQHVERSAW